MIIDLRGVQALQQLRMDLQEAAGEDFPQGCLTELLVLYDVCKAFELSMFMTQDVLGEPAWRTVNDFLNAPVGRPTEAAQTVLHLRAQASPSH